MQKFLMWVFAKAVRPSIKFHFGDDNYFDADENEIWLNPKDNEDCGFLRHLKEVHGFEKTMNYPLWMWSVLHEIGHFETLDFCESDEMTERVICASHSKEEAEQSVELQDLYFNLESEWEATEWAINFIKSHPFLCGAFSVLLR